MIKTKKRSAKNSRKLVIALFKHKEEIAPIVKRVFAKEYPDVFKADRLPTPREEEQVKLLINELSNYLTEESVSNVLSSLIVIYDRRVEKKKSKRGI